MLLETTSKFKANGEIEAKDMIEQYRVEASKKGYTLKKASYEYKTKKSKGEIVNDGYLVSITQVFGDFWEEEE